MLGLTLLSLLIFNRAPHRSLHDLATGSAVLAAAPSPASYARPLAWHWAIIPVFCVMAAITWVKLLWPDLPEMRLAAVRTTMSTVVGLRDPRTETVRHITVGRPDLDHSVLIVHAQVENVPGGAAEMLPILTAAVTAIRRDEADVLATHVLQIELGAGFDFGAAEQWRVYALTWSENAPPSLAYRLTIGPYTSTSVYKSNVNAKRS
jgi:hypothetical protein